MPEHLSLVEEQTAFTGRVVDMAFQWEGAAHGKKTQRLKEWNVFVD